MSDAIRILVIDDSPDDRELYWRALNKNTDIHYDISDAEDGERGLARIEERAPDCILLDYSLPGNNGIEVLKLIHARHPHIPVVMLTGQGNEIVAVTAMREGAQNYISKSTITPEAIQRAIQVAIDHCSMEKRINEQRTSLEIFARALAHDLKEPVRTIQSYLDLLAAQETLSEKGKGYFSYVQNAAGRMAALIDTVHFYMRLDGVDHEIPKDVCDVGAVLQEAKENAAELIRERKLVIASDALPFVKANRMQLLQVLQNLLCNAIYHCGDIDPRVRIEVGEEAGYWAFRFIDNGCGISEAARRKIFEPFTRLDGNYSQGLGLGLAICKKIVESHGGTIRCESAVGGGAAFIFTLPKAQAKGADATPAQSNIAAGTNAGAAVAQRLANVLLVDDNKADLKLVQIMLGEVSRLRCNFLVAQDAYEALKVLNEGNGRANSVDLILLDINMPGMSGLELLGQMRGERGLRHKHVVICSSSAYDKDITRAAELGALGYITKPVELTKLAPLLSKAAGLCLSPAADGSLLLQAA